MNNYSDRYADNWPALSKKAKQLTGELCCYPGCINPATEVHHALYCDKQGAIAGREIAGVHIFPLCDRHHSKERDGAHHWRNWRKDRNQPELGNKNTPKYYLLLRQGWMEKVT